ncbi:MAG: translation elongation factor P, partial [Chlamydiota bacterium]|nr:translation elongation factor P [Chlamydiota bacterium]
FSLQKNILGEYASYLKPNTMLPVLFFEDKPVSAIVPDSVTLEVTLTAAPQSGETHQTAKEATLEGGLIILVPQFIKSGDTLRIDVATKKFIERIKQ